MPLTTGCPSSDPRRLSSASGLTSTPSSPSRTLNQLPRRAAAPDWVPMQTRQSGLEGTGEVRLRDLVKESLRTQMSSCRTMIAA
jgi:hypothetical protein